jgi:hypothetical protein
LFRSRRDFTRDFISACRGSASYKPFNRRLTAEPIDWGINVDRKPSLEGADMKQFALEPNMLTMRGVFYPTGYMFLMFPSEQDARDAERQLEEDGYTGESISLLTSQDIQEKIARTVGSADLPLPSAGTEADTVRHFAELASQGHCALMIHAPSAHATEHVMDVLKHSKISYAQKYRHLVIEDLA